MDIGVASRKKEGGNRICGVEIACAETICGWTMRSGGSGVRHSWQEFKVTSCRIQVVCDIRLPITTDDRSSCLLGEEEARGRR